MKAINKDIENKFYKVLKRKLSLAYFEQWIYENENLEFELSREIYIDLISINFKSKFALLEIEKIIGPFINFGKFENDNIKNYLASIINRDDNASDSIYMTYELYCKGYNFLRKLGLKYGLLVACPPTGNYRKSFEEISKKEQKELLDKFYPDIIQDASNVLNWLKNNQIVILNEVDELGYFRYEDKRPSSELPKSEF